MTEHNSVLTLQFCVNYGGRAEIADAAAAIAVEVAAGRLRADKIDEKVVARYLDEPEIPDVDLFVRSSGEQRISNFLLWQSAYAELVFLDTLFPDFDRRHLWQACETYARRDRRYGGAQPNLLPGLGSAAQRRPCQRARPIRAARISTRSARPWVPSAGQDSVASQARNAVTTKSSAAPTQPRTAMPPTNTTATSIGISQRGR